ncbi:MAG: hypothetical protein ABJP02_07655 [Parasphingorhabdus sp.]|uniref:hypothetical protein n=1 Tax=Parasphingorhabdus sp. TaxID=2709688 RepID=UPI0032991B43
MSDSLPEDSPVPELKRHAKGKRPGFYETGGMDEAMSMIMVLASEFCVLRDRVDTIEHIARIKGVDLAKEIESFEPNLPILEEREKRRQGFLERLYYVTQKKAAEQSSNDTEERYHEVLKDIAET